MKRRNSVLSLLLALVFLLCPIVLPSCEESEEVDGETQGALETTAEIPPERLKIVENGTANYTIVYPDDTPDVVMKAVNIFNEAVYNATGVRLKTKSDFLRIGAERDTEAREILFGKTAYDETKQVLEGLYADQYVMREVGNKIVITAHDDSTHCTFFLSVRSALLRRVLNRFSAYGTARTYTVL